MLKENAITAKYNTKVNQCGLLTRRVDLCIKRLLFLARSKASVHVGAGKLGAVSNTLIFMAGGLVVLLSCPTQTRIVGWA